MTFDFDAGLFLSCCDFIALAFHVVLGDDNDDEINK